MVCMVPVEGMMVDHTCMILAELSHADHIIRQSKYTHHLQSMAKISDANTVFTWFLVA